MNKQLLLAKRPVGLPDEDTWNLVENPIPEVGEGQILVKQLYLSLDPAMRGWINEGKSYIEPVQVGEVMRALTVGRIVASKHPHFKEGHYVSGVGGAQLYSLNDGKGWFPIDPNLAPLPTYIGTLGITGLTAYFAFLDVGTPKEGDVVLISGAAGAVGSVVGQIAKIKGCKAVGIAGSPEKCKYLVEELGFDGAIDYKNEDVREGIKRECPKGIDIYFDNVGGDILDIALSQIRMKARIVICGAISQYNNTTPIKGPSNYMSLLVNRARMEGMVVFDYRDQYAQAAMQMGQWMAQGKLKTKEDIHEGLENFREAFLRLFSGEKMGKLVLKINEDN